LAIKGGDTVGDYKVIDLAGSGGMGAVYKIEHVITKRVEAMKLLPTGISSGPEDVQRFEREIEVQARLHHPNIVALYNAVRDDQSIALIMEYVEGESLQRVLERGRLPLHTAVDYAGQILDALAYAHDKGVIHRDVTPANIIITPEGATKLTDFGLALAANDLRLTGAGVAVGSAWYMSPEQVRAVDQLDARTDLYAMGAILHEMLTGRKLFDADGSFAVMRAQMETVPQPPGAFNPEVPTALDEVVARALAKDPAARFQSADEFRIALEAAIAGMQPTGAAPEIKPAHKAICRHSVRASDSKPSSRRDRFLPSRTAMELVLASTALAAVVCTVVLWPQATRVAAVERVSRDTVSTPAPVTAPPFVTSPAPPDPAVAVQVQEVQMEAARPLPQPAPRSAAPSTASIRKAGKRTFADSGTGRAADLLSPAPPMKPPPSAPKPTTRADVPEAYATYAAPPVTAASNTSAETDAVTQTPEEAQPQKTGNRFIRVLGKLIPFHRRAKNDPADSAKAAATDSIAK
jgi:serine/threonine-protein kinase